MRVKRVLRYQPSIHQSDRRSKRGDPNQRQRRGGDKTKNRRHRENREIFHDSHGSWYWHRQLECRGFSRAVRSKFQERRLAGAETSPKSPRSHFNWRFYYTAMADAGFPEHEIQRRGRWASACWKIYCWGTRALGSDVANRVAKKAPSDLFAHLRSKMSSELRTSGGLMF